MDLFNRNESHKRKLSQSIEREQNSTIENEQSVGCFSGCCKRKKRQIILEQNEKQKKISLPMSHLTRSPLFTETTFCQLDDDPCLQCDVQYGPDIWESTPKCPHKSLNNGRANETKNVTTEVKQMSDAFAAESTPYLNSNINRENSSDITSSKEKPSTDCSQDNQSNRIIMTDAYNWNLPSHELNDDQEPYNWDDQNNQYMTPFDWWSEKTSLANKSIHNRSNQSRKNKDDLDGSYSIASISSYDNSGQGKSLSRPKSNRTMDKISNYSNELKDRLNVTSSRDLSIYAKEHKLRDLNSSTKSRPCESLETMIDNDDQMQIQLSPSKNSMKNIRNTDNEDENRPDKNQSPSDYFTYNAIINIWRYFVQRLSNLIVPSTDAAKSEMLNEAQSDNIGPWWNRRDDDDQTPSIFILINEPQPCISIEQQMCCFNHHR